MKKLHLQLYIYLGTYSGVHKSWPKAFFAENHGYRIKVEPSPFEPDKTRHKYLLGKCRAKNLRFFCFTDSHWTYLL